MRAFHFHQTAVTASHELPQALPAQGFVWLVLEQDELADTQAALQAHLHRWFGAGLVDLHVSDLLNKHLPSHYDYTGQYDVLVFRRLAHNSAVNPAQASEIGSSAPRRRGPPVLRRIDTRPVGFALFDNVLITVHPAQCAVRDAYEARLEAWAQSASPLGAEEANEPGRSAPVRFMPTSPADLMLRLVSQVVDGYLDLRRELTRQLDHWQAELLNPRAKFTHWNSLLDARLGLHQLDEICEDQRSAIQDWIAALNDWPEPEDDAARKERDLLRVRSRDVLEHIERVVHHVRRLEQSAETAVQMHFSAQSHRANDIMRTLTVLTAIFLPLNLIAGIFGMNFHAMPLLDLPWGFWWAVGTMGLMAAVSVVYFWRKRYLETSR